MMTKILGIMCLSSLPYIFSLNGDFVFDDSEAVVKNKDVTSDSWMNCFYNDFWGTNLKSNLSHKSYRPLTTLSFRLNYYLNGKKLSAYPFKVTNLCCHVICSFLIWWAVHNIEVSLGLHQKSKPYLFDTAYLTSILFAVHPVHVEAVSGIVGRADILAAMTFFLAFIMYNKAMFAQNYNFIYLTSSIILSGISMLFKENGVTVLGFCLCYELIIKVRLKKTSRSKKRSNVENNMYVMRIFTIILSTMLFLYGRWVVMGGTTPEFKATDNPTAFSGSLFTKIATYSYIYFLNMILLIWPQWLCYDWSMGCIPLVKYVMDFRLVFAMSTYVYTLLIIRTVIFKKNKELSKRLLVLALALMGMPFLPATNIFYPVGFVIAERVLYIPSAGYCLFVAMGLNKILVKRHNMYKTVLTLLYLLIFIYALRSWRRSIDWGNEHRLFISGASVCPLNAKVHYNIAKALDAKNQTELAIAEYKEAIRLYPGYYQAMNNLGNLLKNHAQLLEAEFYLRTALKQKRDFPAAWMNLGIVLAGTDRFNESELAYNIALEYRKDYPDCFYNMGNLYLETNQTQKAMEHWLKAVNSNPKHVLAWTNLLAFLDNTDKLSKALELLPMALTELPTSPAINFAVANIFGKVERYQEAERHFLKAIKLFGNNVQPLHYSNLGVLYHRWKKYDLAEKMYKNALLVDSTFQSAQKNLKQLQRFMKKLKNYDTH